MTDIRDADVGAVAHPQSDIEVEAGQRTTTFGALRDPQYRLLWLGGLVSFLAVQMQFIARGWLAFDLTGSNKGLGAVYLGFGVPMLLLTPWGGVAADRLSKRRVLIGCQLALALSSGIVAVSISLDMITYPLLIASAVVQGAGFSFLGPARMAFTGELVGPNRLANAIVLQQMSMNGTRIFGPSIAGALIGIAFFGVAGVYYATTILILIALAVSVQLPAGRPRADRPVASPLSELRDGVSYLFRRPILLLLVLTSFVVVMIAFPYVAFLPTLAEEAFDVGASGYGLLSGASAVGALLASFFIASRADGPRAWRMQTIAGVGFGLGIVLLAVAPTFTLAIAAIVFAGGASSAFQSLNNALVLGASDPEYHGRVQSLMMLSFSGFGMAALPLGAVADEIGLRQTMTAMGVVSMVAIAVYATVRSRLLAREASVVDVGAAR
ncbi:MAG TPA: MFS transporter [Acidimicrobiales bacterium]|jgi:MFS family permease|nr:MFS transporter [Acidimicrobiales bacterium]